MIEITRAILARGRESVARLARLGRRVGRGSRLEVGAAWYRELGEPQLTVGLSTATSYAYMNANLARDSQASAGK